ncbi:monovalent cation/H+ antiporter complex subunit F [Streptomyces sp. NBC_01546]|uniref:monovalent cation/H+ antiporter complex subunit F n=1 Tax=Streptomyces sp. NBC_01546 TaxID=2975872 RepID=UPI00386C6B03
MNAWSAAALLLIAAGFSAALWGAVRGSAVRRLAGLCLAGTVTGAVFLVLPMAFGRASYQDLALALAVLSPAGVLVFTRFVGGSERGPEAGESEGPQQEVR